MAFEAGAIMGTVGLDTSPVAVAVTEAVGHAKRLKSAVEGDLGNLQARIDTGGWGWGMIGHHGRSESE